MERVSVIFNSLPYGILNSTQAQTFRFYEVAIFFKFNRAKNLCLVILFVIGCFSSIFIFELSCSTDEKFFCYKMCARVSIVFHTAVIIPCNTDTCVFFTSQQTDKVP